MKEDRLRVRMLGGFSIQYQDKRIGDDRSHKVWLLLAYLICRRGHTAAVEELSALLWERVPQDSKLPNALKTILHRARASLNQLWDGAGRDLLLRQEEGYAWNPAYPLWLDTEEFSRLCSGQQEDRLQALALYRGGFLSRLSGGTWTAEMAGQLKERYVQTALEALPQLKEEGRWQEMAELCMCSVAQEPSEEQFYFQWMNALLEQGNRRGAATVFEDMQERFLADYGILPSEELRGLYRRVLASLESRALSSDVILEQLREGPGPGGAYFCDYDFFKAICQASARQAARTGEAAHLALLSVTDGSGGPLAQRSLSRVMRHLKEVVREGLRRGDIAALCSASQFILLLPQANYESACMVCDRTLRAFVRQYPHSPARFRVSVRPLELDSLPEDQPLHQEGPL